MSSSTQISDALTLGTGALSIAVISPDEHSRGAAIRALGESQRKSAQEFASYPSNSDDVPRMIGNNFDVALIDMDSNPENALDLIESICACGRATAMVYSEQADSELLLRCMRAGAREFLTVPFDPGIMAEALVRASAIHSAVHPPKQTEGRLLVFLSAKGGSGVTTLACSFAVSLAQESGQRVLLIDLSLPLGDAAIDLGVRPEYSTINALESSSRLDSNFLATMLVKHSSGLSVLAAPSEFSTAQFPADAIDKLLEVSRQDFDYVVVDAGSKLDLQNTHLFGEFATLYLVTQIGIPELRNANRLISRLSVGGGPKFEIVINRYDPRRVEIGEEDVRKALTRPADWKIPNNYALVRRMQSTATALTQDDTEISRAIRKMTQSVCDKPAKPEQKPEKKKGFSLFR
jgi:pilus assembly protein CpaE